jgi:hypothetical protein
MYEPIVRQNVIAACRSGQSNAAAGREFNGPSGTVGWWVHQDRAERGELPGRHRSSCHRCDGDALAGAAYAYLLGLYLGDGHITLPQQHRVHNLSIACSDRWPGLMNEAETAMRAVFPKNSVCRVRAKGCTGVKVYSKHLPCLFPQHGPGKKHTRRPWDLVRGLVHSDGSRTRNWAQRTTNGIHVRHEYIRYEFTNKSADIRRIYTDTLDHLGIDWKICSQRREIANISVARKAAVALMDEHIGPKY